MIESFAVAEVSRQDIDLVSEFIFLGLRMNRGIDFNEFSTRFDCSIFDKYRSEIEELTQLELLELTDPYLKLTPRGRLHSNEVFHRFI